MPENGWSVHDVMAVDWFIFNVKYSEMKSSDTSLRLTSQQRKLGKSLINLINSSWKESQSTDASANKHSQIQTAIPFRSIPFQN